MTAVAAPPPIPLGSAVPSLTAHAISVSLPTWDDNVGYEEGDKRVVDRMETGYPRFFIHRSIQKVSRVAKWSRRYREPSVYPQSSRLLSLT
jgi:cystathionine gamma-synthase